MSRIDSITKYPFGETNEENGYRLFPDELENDELVFFHGTAESNLESIVNDGFKIQGSLPSVSFAETSALAWKYASEARSTTSPNGCVIAVRFQTLDRPGIKRERPPIGGAFPRFLIGCRRSGEGRNARD
jgi:hypothetical protein